MSHQDQTPSEAPKFDFDAFPPNTFFHDRRNGVDRRGHVPTALESAHIPAEPPERRQRKDRRRRIDPTTFDKQYTPDELEFMSAMQQFKEHSGRPFPTHREVIKVAIALGYRKQIYAQAV
jgi:hypothetical protein